jgi:hypothetical protein
MLAASPSVERLVCSRVIPVQSTAHGVDAEAQIGAHPAAEAKVICGRHAFTVDIFDVAIDTHSLFYKRLVDTGTELDKPVIAPVGKVMVSVVARKFCYRHTLFYIFLSLGTGGAESGGAESSSEVKISNFHN